MQKCWEDDPYQRGTFDYIEEQVTSMLGGEFQDLQCHRYYQFVPIRDTEIAGVVKDCGMRGENNVTEEDNTMQRGAFNEDENVPMAQQGRRFSY